MADTTLNEAYHEPLQLYPNKAQTPPAPQSLDEPVIASGRCHEGFESALQPRAETRAACRLAVVAEMVKRARSGEMAGSRRSREAY